MRFYCKNFMLVRRIENIKFGKGIHFAFKFSMKMFLYKSHWIFIKILREQNFVYWLKMIIFIVHRFKKWEIVNSIFWNMTKDVQMLKIGRQRRCVVGEEHPSARNVHLFGIFPTICSGCSTKTLFDICNVVLLSAVLYTAYAYPLLFLVCALRS